MPSPTTAPAALAQEERAGTGRAPAEVARAAEDLRHILDEPAGNGTNLLRFLRFEPRRRSGGARVTVTGQAEPLSVIARDGLISGAVAAAISGVPSTIYAAWRGTDPLQASLAAGSLLLPHETRRGRLLLAASVAHGGLSFGWALAMSAALPRRATLRWAALAGLGIAALDLGVIGRRFAPIRSLPQLPQVADHVAFAITVGAVIRLRREGRHRRPR